jgi:hypothetical protein
VQKTLDPANRSFREKDDPMFAAFPHDTDFGAAHFKWSSVEREPFGDPQTGSEQDLDQRSHPQSRKLADVDAIS